MCTWVRRLPRAETLCLYEDFPPIGIGHWATTANILHTAAVRATAVAASGRYDSRTVRTGINTEAKQCSRKERNRRMCGAAVGKKPRPVWASPTTRRPRARSTGWQLLVEGRILPVLLLLLKTSIAVRTSYQIAFRVPSRRPENENEPKKSEGESVGGAINTYIGVYGRSDRRHQVRTNPARFADSTPRIASTSV